MARITASPLTVADLLPSGETVRVQDVSPAKTAMMAMVFMAGA